jgi:hypothetical protein
MWFDMKCKCGATLHVEDPRGVYLLPGGEADERGRKYLIERRVDEWQDRHQVCLTAKAESSAEQMPIG